MSAFPLAARIAAIADCAERWRDADFPPRVRVTARLRERTGYGEPTIDFALDTLFGALRAEDMRAAIAREIGDSRALDAWIAMPGGRVRYVPRGPAAIVASRTTIGVALTPACFALLAGASVLVKDRADELCGEFFRTLARMEPRFADTARAAVWEGARGYDFRGFASVAAFGGRDALRAIRASLAPETAFYGFGPRASCVVIDLAACDDRDDPAITAALDGVARDAILYDAEGCMSAHLVFVVDGTDDAARENPRLHRLVDALHAACLRAAIEFPPGTARADALAARAAARYRAAAAAAGAPFRGDADPRSPAVYVERAAAPPFAPGLLPLVPVRGPEEIAAYLARHEIAIEAAALFPATDALRACAAATGAARLTACGELQRPPLTVGHGGVGRLAPFVRRCDDVAGEYDPA